jgi:hypothetical protein
MENRKRGNPSFKKGESGNPNGRPVGSQNKLTVMFREILKQTIDDMQNDPKHNMLSWAKENPTEFWKIASKLIPVEIKAHIENKVIRVTLKGKLNQGNQNELDSGETQ